MFNLIPEDLAKKFIDGKEPVYDKGTVRIGCQSIPFEQVEAIYNAAKKSRE